MDLVESYYCCGLFELGNFDDAPITKEEFHVTMRSTWGYNAAQGKRIPALIATTVTYQRKAIKLLTSLGFVKTNTFTNPSTGALVTMWYHPPKVWIRAKRSTR